MIVYSTKAFSKRAAKDVGREDLSAHDLRRFAGSKNAQVATLTENMARFGHKTVKASLRYQHSQSSPMPRLPLICRSEPWPNWVATSQPTETPDSVRSND